MPHGFRIIFLLLLLLVVGSPFRNWFCSALRIRATRSNSNGQQEQPEDLRKQKSWTASQTKKIVDTRQEQSDMYNSSFSAMLFETIDKAYTTLSEDVRPLRDIWDGFTSAGTLVWSGWYQGFDGFLFDYPRRAEGIAGFVKGSIAGAFHLSVMTASGVAAGMYQVVRGMERTWEAVQATAQGKVWSWQKQEWFFYSLDEEADRLMSQEEQRQQQRGINHRRRMLRKQVKDSSFYDRLQIPVDATHSEIKKAYYRQALQVHPDKNAEQQDEATDHFRSLHKVYQTLASEETRALYDTHGVCFSEHLHAHEVQVDPYIFFAIVFGSRVVEPYVGDLAIASIVDNTLLLTNKAKPAGQVKQQGLDDSDQQLRRQVNIATHLRERIDDYTFGRISKEDFRTSCRTEAQALAMAMESELQVRFLLESIASGLISATVRSLLPAWSKPLLGWAYKALDITRDHSKIHLDLEKAIQQALRDILAEDAKENEAAFIVNQYQQEHEEDDPLECGQDKKQKAQQSNADVDVLLKKLSNPRLLKLAYQFNANDITRTLRESSKRVLDDAAENQELRSLRAQALNTMGHEFHAAAILYQKHRKGKRKADDGYPDLETIQKTVQSALAESVINEGVFG